MSVPASAPATAPLIGASTSAMPDVASFRGDGRHRGAPDRRGLDVNFHRLAAGHAVRAEGDGVGDRRRWQAGEHDLHLVGHLARRRCDARAGRASQARPARRSPKPDGSCSPPAIGRRSPTPSRRTSRRCVVIGRAWRPSRKSWRGTSGSCSRRADQRRRRAGARSAIRRSGRRSRSRPSAGAERASAGQSGTDDPSRQWPRASSASTAAVWFWLFPRSPCRRR